jgi:transposase
MDVIEDDAKGGFRRVEVLTGPGRRRRWSAAEKGRIVAETLRPGTSVTEVARRWQVCPQQVWGWRREARTGQLMLPETACASAPALRFVPIVADAAAADDTPSKPHRTTRTVPAIEVRLAGAVVRVAADTDSAVLTEVLRAVRASAS